MEIIRLVEQSSLSVRPNVGQLGIPRSTFFCWSDRYRACTLKASRIVPRQLLSRLFGLWPVYDHEAIDARRRRRASKEVGDLDTAAGTGVSGESTAPWK